MSNLNYLPSLGATGLWSLTAPYSSQVLATTPYECIATISLAGAIAQGQDPLNTVYLASGDSEASFNRDLLNDDFLVIIKSGPGDIVTFPRSAMTSVPSTDGIVYTNTLLMASLSALPVSLNLDALKTDIQAVILNSVGVKSSIYEASIGAATILTIAQDAAVTAARQINITSPESLKYRNTQLQLQLTQAQEKIAALEAYIREQLTS